MFTNLLIASAFIITILIVIVNFGRIFEFVEFLKSYINKFKSFIGILIQAYRNQRQFTP